MRTITPLSLTIPGLFLFLFIAFNSFSQGDGEYHQMTVDVDGLTRSYLLYEPEGHSSTIDWPLVIQFHGFGGSGSGMNNLSELYRVADTAKFLLVSPDGLTVQDLIFGGAAPGWHVPANYLASHDDIAFVDAIIDDLISSPEFGVDTNRIHATGFSNGSEMAYYAACALSDRIASVAGVSGQMAYAMTDSICTPDRQVSVLHMLGTNDPFYPNDGDETFPPLEGTSEYWAEIDNCNTTPTETVLPDIDPDDNTTVTLLDYEACDFGFEVLCYRIEGGNHCWPGSTMPCNRDIHASSEIWWFFLRNPNPDIYSCLPDGIIFYNQSDLDNFQLHYPLCMEIMGDVEISGNDIEHLDALNNVQSIGGALEIYTNEGLENINGLANLEYIDKDLQIFNNMNLESFTGLESLKHIGGDFVVSVNNVLDDMSSLDSLEYVGEDIMVVSNELLPGLTGLDNVDTSSFLELTIKNNGNLSFCAVQSICQFISDPANEQDIDIRNNAPGCNSDDEVELECVNATEELTNINKLAIHPNPFSGSTTIEISLTTGDPVELIIYNNLGKLIQLVETEAHKEGIQRFTWNPENLPAGVYLCVLKTNIGLQTVKMIKLE